MSKIEITSYDELLQFLEREDIPQKAMNLLANKFLKTYSWHMSKKKLRQNVKHYIERFCIEKDGSEKPLFLD